MEDLPRFVKGFISKSNPKENEVEFRFTERNGPRFSLTDETFFRFIDEISKSSIWGNKVLTNDVVTISKSLNKELPDVRKIDDKKTIIYQTKTRKGVDYYNDFNIKASEAKETDVNLDEESWSTQYIPNIQRERKRISFTEDTNKWKLDIV